MVLQRHAADEAICELSDRVDSLPVLCIKPCLRAGIRRGVEAGHFRQQSLHRSIPLERQRRRSFGYAKRQGERRRSRLFCLPSIDEYVLLLSTEGLELRRMSDRQERSLALDQGENRHRSQF